MLTKAIIIGKEFDSNMYIVRIPLLETADSNEPYIATATLCTDDGVLNPFNQGDVVFVGFEHNKFDHPVILGKLSKEGLLNNNSLPVKASYEMQGLEVLEKVNLPVNTTIGELTYEQLIQSLRNMENLTIPIIDLIPSDE